MVRARQVVLATNAFPPLLRRLRPVTVPVYDYALMTEPLTGAQRASIGWRHRQGVGDAGNQFHYYRLTRDDRILWGGYDAVYHYGSRIAAGSSSARPPSPPLAEHFFATFPQLAGLRFTHRWGGVIDTCTRFCAVLRHRVRRPAGVRARLHRPRRRAPPGSARDVMLDLLAGGSTPSGPGSTWSAERRCRSRRSRVRSAGIQLTRWSLARADAHDGRRNLWLRTLDRLGLGFDS